MLEQGVGQGLKKCMLMLFLLLCLGALLLGPRTWEYDPLALLGGGLLLALAFFGLRPLAESLAGLGQWKLWALLTGVCLVVKSAWIFCVQVPPAGDYAVFWGYAAQMAQWDLVYGGRYLALFPHLYGYSAFLAGCLRVLGMGSLVAPLVNVFLTILSGTALFLLFRRDPGRGAAAYLLWILCPSQSMYNALVLSEPLYTALLLGFLLLVSLLEERQEKTGKPIPLGILAGVGGGILLRWFQMVRPIAAIPLIALLIWRGALTERKKNIGLWRAFLPVLLTVYVLVGFPADSRVEAMAGEKPASVPGYSVLVGLNRASGGSWSQEDGETLALADSRPGSTAQGVQEEMWALAKARARSGEVDYPALLLEKGRTFLGRDDACVLYCEEGLSHMIRYQILCNGFWYFALALAMLGGVVLWRRREGSWLLLAPLYVLGLSLAQMLVEVAGRYHYSLLPMLLLVGVWGLFEIKWDKKKGTEEQ